MRNSHGNRLIFFYVALFSFSQLQASSILARVGSTLVKGIIKAIKAIPRKTIAQIVINNANRAARHAKKIGNVAKKVVSSTKKIATKAKQSIDSTSEVFRNARRSTARGLNDWTESTFTEKQLEGGAKAATIAFGAVASNEGAKALQSVDELFKRIAPERERPSCSDIAGEVIKALVLPGIGTAIKSGLTLLSGIPTMGLALLDIIVSASN